MTTVKIHAALSDTAFIASGTHNGVAFGPLDIPEYGVSSAPLPTGTGTFRAQVSIEDQFWTGVADGDVIETVAPGRIRVWADDFSGWAENDPRHIHVETDMGERYDFRHTNHADLPAPNVLRRLAGTQAGFYPGILCGHAMRGTDMQGNQVLTAAFDQGNGAPVGTLDQTVSVYVSDGLASRVLTFTVRLIHPDVYYADRTKAIYNTSAPEAQRRGTFYISRDGDFTGAPAERAETATVAGIYHRTLPDGTFDRTLFERVGLPWTNYPESAQLLFKAGERYFPTESLSPDWAGINGTWGTWYHGGANGAEDATFDAENIAGFNIRENKPRGLFQSNFSQYAGTRIHNLVLHASDYDPSDQTWREWWNIIRYTNKVGTVAQNTSGVSSNGYNGETLSNGSGVYTEVISDDNAGTLICRQVVNTADVEDPAAQQAFFVDGDTLTGETNGATLTFVAAGSRQDRTRKVPGAGLQLLNAQGLLYDNLQIIGPSTGVGGVGPGAVISDVLVKNYWNYGGTVAAGPAQTSLSEIGCVTVQPIGFEGTPRSFGGASVSGNRNSFNTMIDATSLALNDVSHSGRRYARMHQYSMHYCFFSTYGGHGGGHQPVLRLATQGADSEFQITCQIYGCGVAGGGLQVNFGLANPVIPLTPEVIRVERTHMLATFATVQGSFSSVYSNYVVRNCILDRPAGNGWDDTSIEWIIPNTATFPTDPDVNAVEPVIEFNTFTALLNTTPASTVPARVETLRSIPIQYRNNAYIVDQAVLGAIDEGVLALADAPGDYDSELRPLASAKAYRSGIGDAAQEDAAGVTRPETNFSQGAREPIS